MWPLCSAAGRRGAQARAPARAVSSGSLRDVGAHRCRPRPRRGRSGRQSPGCERPWLRVCWGGGLKRRRGEPPHAGARLQAAPPAAAARWATGPVRAWVWRTMLPTKRRRVPETLQAAPAREAAAGTGWRQAALHGPAPYMPPQRRGRGGPRRCSAPSIASEHHPSPAAVNLGAWRGLGSWNGVQGGGSTAFPGTRSSTIRELA